MNNLNVYIRNLVDEVVNQRSQHIVDLTEKSLSSINTTISIVAIFFGVAVGGFIAIQWKGNNALTNKVDNAIKDLNLTKEQLEDKIKVLEEQLVESSLESQVDMLILKAANDQLSGNYDEEEKHLFKATKLLEDNKNIEIKYSDEIFLKYAESLIVQYKYDEAVSPLDKIIAINSNSDKALYNLAVCKFESLYRQSINLAEEYIDSALRLNGSVYDYLLLKYRILSRQYNNRVKDNIKNEIYNVVNSMIYERHSAYYDLINLINEYQQKNTYFKTEAEFHEFIIENQILNQEEFESEFGFNPFGSDEDENKGTNEQKATNIKDI